MHLPASQPDNTKRHKLMWGLAGLSLVWVVFNLSTLTRYPTVTCDEAFYARTALNYFRGVMSGSGWPHSGINFYFLYGRLYWLMLGAILTFATHSIFAARLVSLFGWAVLIILTYILGQKYVSVSVGRWAAVLMACAWVPMFSGHLTRPDIWAAAASILTLIVYRYALSPDAKRRWSILLGIALAVGFLFHPIDLHITMSVLLLITVEFLLRRRYARFLTVVGTFAVAMLLIGWMNLGIRGPEIIGKLILHPLATLQDYNLAGALTGAPKSSPLDVLILAGASFASFWWHYYAWYAPIISLPQGFLSVAGLGCGLFGRNSYLRRLAIVILVSSGTFAIVNFGYTLAGYALQWMPIYFVLGVSATDQYLDPIPIAAWSQMRWVELALSSLVAVSVVGSIHLGLLNPAGDYKSISGRLGKIIRPQTRVLASSNWWFALPRNIELIDETSIVPKFTGLWWNSVPDEEVGSLTPILPNGSLLPDLRRLFMSQDGPDYVLSDGGFACLTIGGDSSGPLTSELAMIVNETCSPIDTIETHSYGTLALYDCRSNSAK